MNEKGRPGDFLHCGTFSEPEMPQFSLHPSRRRLALTLALLFPVTSLVAQNSAPTPSISLPGTQSPFTGSEPEGKATPEVLQLYLSMPSTAGCATTWAFCSPAIRPLWRGAKDGRNSATSCPTYQPGCRKMFKPRASPLSVFKANFFRSRCPASSVRFNYIDARASFSQSLLNFKDLEKERAASESLKSAQYSYKDARELVVLAVGNAYLLAIATAARIETADAQVNNAQALYDKAVDQQKAGLSPAIDTLRSQVELQTRQQQLIAARNDFAKQKLSLARVIGLPPGQEFALTEKAPYQSLTPLPLEVYLQRAYASRSDYQAAQAQVRAAELSHRAAAAGHYPSLDVNANYGDIGVTPAHSNGTWQVNGGLNIPIFAGGKTHSDVLEADAQLKQARSQLNDLRGRIDYRSPRLVARLELRRRASRSCPQFRRTGGTGPYAIAGSLCRRRRR